MEREACVEMCRLPNRQCSSAQKLKVPAQFLHSSSPLWAELMAGAGSGLLQWLLLPAPPLLEAIRVPQPGVWAGPSLPQLWLQEERGMGNAYALLMFRFQPFILCTCRDIWGKPLLTSLQDTLRFRLWILMCSLTKCSCTKEFRLGVFEIQEHARHGSFSLKEHLVFTSLFRQDALQMATVL